MAESSSGGTDETHTCVSQGGRGRGGLQFEEEGEVNLCYFSPPVQIYGA